MEREELKEKLKRIKSVEELAKLVSDNYIDATETFLSNIPEEYKINIITDKDDISITTVEFGDDDIDYMHWDVFDEITDRANPEKFNLGLIRLAILSTIENFKKEKKYTIEDYKKIIISTLIKNKVYLYQNVFQQDLLEELQPEEVFSIPNELYDAYVDTCRQVYSIVDKNVRDKTAELVISSYGEIDKSIETLESECDRLERLTPEEREKLDNYMLENLGKENPDTGDKLVSAYHGDTIDERIYDLEQQLDEMIDCKWYFNRGIDSKYFSDYAIDEFEYNSKMGKVVEKRIFDYCVSKVYPNGIIEGNAYSKELIGDCEFVVRMTNAYRNMTGDTQTELLKSIENMKVDKKDKSDKPLLVKIGYGYVEKQELVKSLELLDERSADILRLRYGLDDGKYKTLKEVGDKYKITPERVKQIESKAIRQLVNYLTSNRKYSSINDVVDQMAQGKDVLGENQPTQDSNNKQLGFTVPWLLGLATGIVSVGLIILGVILTR